MGIYGTTPPGSDEAVAAGCRCAVLDNGHGKGCGYTDAEGAPLYWISADCPLHGSTLEGTVQVTGDGK